MDSILTIDALRKSYGDIVAVDGISFSVAPNQVFCLVGPNGAGKTTTVECILGLRKHDSGTVQVLGLSPQRDRTRVFRQVGVQFQENSLYPMIKVWEAIHLFASMYDQPLDPEELLDIFDLQKRKKVAYRGLSGGERRKLLIAIALVGNPKVLVLDEPTSGLDPHARRALWSTLNRFREQGLTILMTTHNMQEAQEQSDVVCMIDEGKIIASGSSRQLLEEYKLGTRIAVTINGRALEGRLFEGCPGMTRVDVLDHLLCIYGVGNEFTASATKILQDHGVQDYAMRPADLEDLYLMITGTHYEREAS